MATLHLASGSPRRRTYLLELGFDFRVVRTTEDERRLPEEKPDAYVRRLARLKADKAAVSTPGAVVLAADTTVTIDGEILEKPKDEADFRRMMALLSGRTHEVLTGVCARIVGGASFDDVVTSKVTFRALTEDQIGWYWLSGEPKDKAGGYAVQGRAGAFITRIDGSYSNVVGLPLPETLAVLEQAGVKPPWLDPRFKP